MESQGVDGDLQWIKLLPKNQESSFKYIMIGLNKGSLGGMELRDNFGQLTRIYFSNVLLNPPINRRYLTSKRLKVPMFFRLNRSRRKTQKESFVLSFNLAPVFHAR